MKANKNMSELLSKHSIRLADPLPQSTQYPIWTGKDCTGRTYWGVSSFCGLNKFPISGDRDLSQLEWDGNEVYLDAVSDAQVTHILRQAIGIITYWKRELETQYPETPFYILASYDNGDMLFLEDDELPTRSGTLRFWADRGSNTVIYLDDYDDWEQPAILVQCNSHS